jgi:hypothetical protein
MATNLPTCFPVATNPVAEYENLTRIPPFPVEVHLECYGSIYAEQFLISGFFPEKIQKHISVHYSSKNLFHILPEKL